MVSQTTIGTDENSAYLKRYIKNRIVVVEFPLDTVVTVIEEYFNLDDEVFYNLRSRKLKWVD